MTIVAKRVLRLVGALALLGVASASVQAQSVSVPLRTRTYGLKDAVPDKNGIHRMAVLRALNKTTGRAVDVNAPVGVPIMFGTLLITVQSCHTVPPEEPPETTAFLQIDEVKNGQPNARLFSGWMFASSPGLNGLEHAVYDVWVITCKTDEPSQEPAPSATTTDSAGKPAAAPALPKPAAPAATPPRPAAGNE